MAAKEMLIVFLYDVESCTKEDDDPMSALLFFAPSWVGEAQKLSLVGQLMGTSHFFKETFCRPHSITLQSGKFALRYFGRYILAVGTDRNVVDSILVHRADLLSALIQLYHCDIESIKSSFLSTTTAAGTSSVAENESLLQVRKNFTDKLYHIFDTYLPMLQYNGHVFYNVSRLSLPKSASNVYLETMQVLESCQQEPNVLGGQVMYHNKVIATQLSSDLAKIIVISDPLRIKTADGLANLQFHVPVGVHLMTVYISSKDLRELKKASEKAQSAFTNSNPNLLPFTLKKKSAPAVAKEPTLSGMKRDRSLIFTHIPEEECVNGSEATNGTRKPSLKSRPTHLPLKLKNMTSKELPESGFSSINFDENDSYPDFIGKTSVCSTPMTENKILHHGNILSICANTCAEFENIDSKTPPRDSPLPPPKGFDSPKKSPKRDFQLPVDTINYVNNPYKSHKRRNSWGSMGKSLQKIASKLKSRSGEDSEEEDFVDDLEKPVKSITDPTFPIVTAEGEPISRYLFEEFLDFHYSSMCKARNGVTKPPTPPVTNGKPKTEPESKPQKPQPEEIPPKKTEKRNRKALSLPLKSRNQPADRKVPLEITAQKIKGLPLTPLMAKLTILAMSEERAMDSLTPGSELAPPIRRPSVTKAPIVEEAPVSRELVKVDLFVCGQQNMTMVMLLEEGAGRKAEVVQNLFEVCVSKLTKIEANLHQVLNMNVEGNGVGDKGEGSYSFMAIDSKKWDLMEKTGPWSAQDLAAVECMHADMRRNSKFTDMILRNDESLLYGYQCGNVELFYQQSHNATAGLPPPSDIMGFVNSVSKRRLERDHSVVLL